MTLTQLTTALHRWADSHGGQFPDAMICTPMQHTRWVNEADERWGLNTDWASAFKGVTIIPILTPDDERVLFASPAPN